MRSVTTRLFAGMILVSLIALALGAWWVRRTVEGQLGRTLIVEQTVQRINGEQVVRETRREHPGGPVVDEALRGPAIDVAQLNRRLLIALSVVVFGAAVVTALIARRVLGPVRALRHAVDQMAAGGSARVDIRGDDELAALGRRFNEMADAVARQDQLKRDLTNDIAHELRTPLTDLRCHLEALQDGVADVTPDTLGQLHAEVAHLQRLVDDLGELARAEARQLPLAPERVDVGATLDGLARQAAARAAALAVTVQVDAAPGVIAWVDPGRLKQIVGNLMDNALVHTPPGGVVRVTAGMDGAATFIAVADSGPGIPAEHLPHVFERFYRADPSRSRTTGGVGLGLAIARQLAEASGGRIDAACPAEGGTVFRLTLPTSASQLLHKPVV